MPTPGSICSCRYVAKRLRRSAIEYDASTNSACPGAHVCGDLGERHRTYVPTGLAPWSVNRSRSPQPVDPAGNAARAATSLSGGGGLHHPQAPSCRAPRRSSAPGRPLWRGWHVRGGSGQDSLNWSATPAPRLASRRQRSAPSRLLMSTPFQGQRQRGAFVCVAAVRGGVPQPWPFAANPAHRARGDRSKCWARPPASAAARRRIGHSTCVQEAVLGGTTSGRPPQANRPTRYRTRLRAHHAATSKDPLVSTSFRTGQLDRPIV